MFGPGANPGPDLVGATLLGELAASDNPFVLVLDDYHVISAEPIHRLVRFLVDHGPPFAHLVLLTRADPPLPVARLRAHGRLVEIRANDLRCDSREASAYLADGECHARARARRAPPRSHRGLDRGPPAGGDLVARTTRCRRAHRGLPRQPALRPRLPRRRGARRTRRRPALVPGAHLDRRALRRRAVPGTDRSGRRRRAARASGAAPTCSSSRSTRERRWYRYHGLFADYLRAQLTEQEQAELHERAATHLEAQGLGQEAIAHALAAGSIDRAIRLIEREARPAFEAGELTTLLGWLDALPAERLAASGELVSLQAWALLFAGQPAAARAAVDSRRQEAGASGPAEGRLVCPPGAPCDGDWTGRRAPRSSRASSCSARTTTSSGH